MTRGEMKTALQRYGFDTTDPLDTWINWGMHDLEKEAEWPFLFYWSGPTPGIILANTREILNLITTNYKKITTLKISGKTDPLEYVPFGKFQRDFITDLTITGTPTHYTVYGNWSVLVYPTADINYTIELFAKMTESDLSADGNSPQVIPTHMHNLIVLKAAVYGLDAEDEQDRAQSTLKQYNDGVDKSKAEMLGFVGHRAVDDVMGYGTN